MSGGRPEPETSDEARDWTTDSVGRDIHHVRLY